MPRQSTYSSRTTRRRRTAVDDHVATPEAAPAVPEDQRQDEPECSDDHQDHADRLQVDLVHLPVDGELEDRADGDQEDACTKAHWKVPPS